MSEFDKGFELHDRSVCVCELKIEKRLDYTSSGSPYLYI